MNTTASHSLLLCHVRVAGPAGRSVSVSRKLAQVLRSIVNGLLVNRTMKSDALMVYIHQLVAAYLREDKTKQRECLQL